MKDDKMGVMASERDTNLNWASGWQPTPGVVPMEEAAETVGAEINALPPELRTRLLGAVAGDDGIDDLLQKLCAAVAGCIGTANPNSAAAVREAASDVLSKAGVRGNTKLSILSHVMAALSHLPVNQEE